MKTFLIVMSYIFTFIVGLKLGERIAVIRMNQIFMRMIKDEIAKFYNEGYSELIRKYLKK